MTTSEAFRPRRLGPSAYLGRRARHFETSVFHLAESTYRLGTELPLHTHARAHFCLVLSGSYVDQVDDREVRRLPGDLVFYAAGVAHAETHSRAGRHFMIEVDSALGREIEGLRLDRSWSSGSGAASFRATRLFALFRRDDAFDRAALSSLVGRLVEEVSRDRRELPRWLADTELRLRSSREGNPDLDKLAREVGVHPVSLGRSFRRAFGCTPGEYQRRFRVRLAQRDLAALNSSLAEVAYGAGFCDQSHLNRVFKRQTGLTPGQYRRFAQANLGS